MTMETGYSASAAHAARGPVTTSSQHLRSLWSRRLPAFGLWSSLVDPSVAELLAATSFDYLCVDLQHGIATYSELPNLVHAMRGAGRAPVVRVPWNDPASVMRAIDVGACGVIVPMVNSADEASRAAQACRFPPTGGRSWGPMWGDSRPDGALMPADQDELATCLVMVETQAGVDVLDEIVATPGVDGVYIGPNDLALSCGYGRATYRDSPDVDALIQRIVDACNEAGIVAGLHCSSPDMAADWAARGVTMLTVTHDTTLLRSAAASAWSRLDELAALAGRRAAEPSPSAP